MPAPIQYLEFLVFSNAGYYQNFIYSPTDALLSCLKNNIKIYIKTAGYVCCIQYLQVTTTNSLNTKTDES